MIRLRSSFYCGYGAIGQLCGLVCGISAMAGCLRRGATRQLACVAATGLLLSGCTSSSTTEKTGDAGTVAPAPPLNRGAVPGAGNPAGIQLYTQTPDGIFLLLADHAYPSQRGWAGFGGAADAGETIAETAARETEEETRGYFKRENLLAAIQQQEPIFDGKFAFYFVKVDWVPAEVINNHPIGEEAVFAERGPYVWVPYSEVERCLEQLSAASSRNCVIDPRYLPAKSSNTNWFWPLWLNNFRVARSHESFPLSGIGR